MQKLIFYLIFISLLFSCKSDNNKLNKAINFAGSNKSEILKVINYFKEEGNKEKIQAANFLITNMIDKYSLEGKSLDVYFNIYEHILNLYNNGVRDNDILDSIVLSKIDSLEAYYGPVKYDKLEKKYDLQYISSGDLIKNINLAYNSWESEPWAKHINFNQFCEYILPYRIDVEPYEEWRTYLINKYSILSDSIKSTNDPKIITRILCDYIYNDWKHLDNFSKYGYFPSIKKIDHYQGGICEHHYLYLTALLRCFGVAVSIDYTPQWRNYPGEHSWLALIDTTGQFIFFNPGNPEFTFTNKVPMGSTGSSTKMYRKTFSHQNEEICNKAKIELYKTIRILDNHHYDVTNEYKYPQSNIQFEIKRFGNSIIYLNSFGYGGLWSIIDGAKMKKSRVDFNNIGFPAVYIASIYSNGHEKVVMNPFITNNTTGTIKILNPDTINKRQITLTRKFPVSDSMYVFSSDMIGAKFQGANKNDFSDSEDLYIIEDTTEYYVERKINSGKKYRYIRYLSNPKKRINVAEIEFYGIKGNNRIKLQGNLIYDGKIIFKDQVLLNGKDWKNIFDSDIRTNLSAISGSWVGMDFGVPVEITKIKYLPRNNFNIIEVGNSYELFYFNNYWQPLGRKTATDNFIIFENVPDNSLLVLKNILQGKEERIFTYENGKQIWW